MTPEFYNEGQVLLIDKSLDWTSFQAVKKLKYLTKSKKIGHAGTLDPLATGLLIICTGKFTKKIDQYQAQEKEYTGSFFLGATTPSSDRETEVDKQFDISDIDAEKIELARQKFVGEITQIPPVYSALKINGKRAYESARLGIEVKMKARQVSITEFEITKIELPLVYFRVVCSKGTYIRTLASDFGNALNNGAYLNTLRRTRIGEYDVKDAKTVQEFEEMIRNNGELRVES